MGQPHARQPNLEQQILSEFLERRPDLADCEQPVRRLYEELIHAFESDGTLFVCGNGGSHADAAHIVGELCKSFARKRPVSAQTRENLEGLPWGEELAEHLEEGFRAITLGLNGSVKTAVENDSPLRDVAFAQEVYALARPGDVVLAISTSGNARNCLMALSAAKAAGCTTAALTGPHGGKLAMHADIAIRAAGDSVARIQESHICVYHTVCEMVEAHYFPELR